MAGLYNSLYRKYRPDTFDGLIGQEQIVRTLKNQIKRGSVGHAYLFTGTRGTGKTSTAKIFARAVNCLSPVEGSPCGKCAACEELSSPNTVDIIEIDAASNNGVDEIRELRENVNYRPAIASKKVYIIDEVHMLSASAYNALLKTLEEPPEHVIFILATTEVHKIPATILSRCLRFDFKLIPEELVARQIADIFTENGVKFEDAAVRLIASAGGGSDRDSLSLADMCLAFSDGTVTYENVLEVLGAGDPEAVLGIADAIIDGDIGRALSDTARVIGLGKSISLLASDVAGVFRNAILIKTAHNAETVLKLPEKYFAGLKKLADKSTLRMLIKALDGFSSMDSELRYGSAQRTVFEAAVVKTASKINDESRLDELEKRLASIEGGADKPLPAKPGDASQKKNLNGDTFIGAASVSEGALSGVGLPKGGGIPAANRGGIFNETVSDVLTEASGGGGIFNETAFDTVTGAAITDADAGALWKAATRIIREASVGFLGIEMETLKATAVDGDMHVSVDENNMTLKRGNKSKIEAALKEAGFSGGLFLDIRSRHDDGSVIAKLKEDFGDEIKIII
jgi:DNA polymerase-3 subunit gamma/tau